MIRQAIAATTLCAWAASVWFAYSFGQDAEIASQAREAKAAASATEAAASAAASAIARLEVRHATIRQQAETIIREVPVYRDCAHDDRMLDAINAARGHSEPAGDRVVSDAASAP